MDIRDEDITEEEAYNRLTSYVVVRIVKATDPYDVDSEGHALPPTWEKASHSIRRDVSQHDARRKVRKLDRETGSVADKKKHLPSVIQRQLEYAWKNLERTESDPRFVYTLAQVDWKSKVGEIEGGEERRDRRSKDKKRSRNRHGSKGSSRSKAKSERVSVTAYFRREPGRNENCARILEAQLAERRQGARGAHDDHLLPLRASSGRAPLPRNVQAGPSQIQTQHYENEPQVKYQFPWNQHSIKVAQPAVPTSIPPRSSISQAIEDQNRRIQSNAPRLDREATARSYDSRSSVTSFSSLSTEESGAKVTPSSSYEQNHSLSTPHVHQLSHQQQQQQQQQHGDSRGRTSYRQHRSGDEAVMLEVARPQRPYNPAERFINIPPAAPDPINAVSEDDMRRRVNMMTYHGGMARSMGEESAPRQFRGIRKKKMPESQRERDPMYHTARYHSGSNQDMDQLGDEFRRTSLVDGSRNRSGEARDPDIHYNYREAPRRHRDDDNDDDNDGLAMPRPVRGPWRRRDAQRYMAERRRTDQDAWDLGRMSPLLYGKGQRKNVK
ncbi:hypothetical protein MKX07_000828 [Trichoderma sp. CBMAI-0711]|nr:hypothetical protein MKX07_000828 [Trichoderma sp. CBMAI-0711]